MNCKVCNKELGIYAHHATQFCGETCRTIEIKRRSRLAREQRKKFILLKTCKRCHRRFRPINKTKRICGVCDGTITRKETYHQCADCPSRIIATKKRCYKCEQKEIARVRAANRKRHQDDSQKRKKERIQKGITNKKPGINPKWLTRGNIGNSSIHSVITNGE